MQACVDSKCRVFIVSQGSSSQDNYYLNYLFLDLASTPDGSTTMTISVSADGGYHGSCSGNEVGFDDFYLV
jgi:hypothetical protein